MKKEDEKWRIKEEERMKKKKNLVALPHHFFICFFQPKKDKEPKTEAEKSIHPYSRKAKQIHRATLRTDKIDKSSKLHLQTHPRRKQKLFSPLLFLSFSLVLLPCVNPSLPLDSCSAAVVL